jgi:hypothetical protein
MRSRHVRSLLVVLAIGCAPSALAEDPAPEDADQEELSLDEGGAPPLAVQPPVAPAPGSPSDRWACTLVLGGGGTVFDDEEVNAAFREFDDAVTETLYSFFFVNQYPVKKLFSTTRDPEERVRAALAEMSKHRCGRMVQLSHFLKVAGIRRTIGYEVSILVPVAETSATETGGQTYVLKSVFERRFEYPFIEKELAEMPTMIANLIGRALARSEPMER